MRGNREGACCYGDAAANDRHGGHIVAHYRSCVISFPRRRHRAFLQIAYQTGRALHADGLQWNAQHPKGACSHFLCAACEIMPALSATPAQRTAALSHVIKPPKVSTLRQR